MKKFVFLYVGLEPPTQEIKDAWLNWFASIADSLVDSGNPFGSGREITRTGTRELALDKGAITGYSIINADSMDEAEKIAQGCPSITGVQIYEASAYVDQSQGINPANARSGRRGAPAQFKYRGRISRTSPGPA